MTNSQKLFTRFLKLRRIFVLHFLKRLISSLSGVTGSGNGYQKGSSNDASVGKRRKHNSGLNTTGFAGLWTFPVDLVVSGGDGVPYPRRKFGLPDLGEIATVFSLPSTLEAFFNPRPSSQR